VRAAPASLNVESTLRDRYPITVPQALPGAFQLGKGDKIRYIIRPSGEVLLNRTAGRKVDDPLLGGFLDFLAAYCQPSRAPESSRSGAGPTAPIPGRGHQGGSRFVPVGAR